MTIEQREPIILKKYPSRRLYDTHNKRFVTLRQLANIIRDGQDVTVIDKESGEDITKTVLTQIIMEEEKEHKDILPVALLQQLIRTGGSVYKDSLEGVLSIGARTLQQAKDRVESAVLHLPHRGKPKPADSKTDEFSEIKARLSEIEARLAESKPKKKS